MRRTISKKRQRNPIARAFRVLAWMATSPDQGHGARAIAANVDMAPSTVHRILAMLQEVGLVRRDTPDGGYTLGLEFVRIASQVASQLPLRATALRAITDLVEACDETALLGVYDPQRMEMIYIATVETRHPVRYFVDLYQWLPLAAGAGGLAILAFLPKKQQDLILRKPIRPFTERTITNRNDLKRELTDIRRRGYAFSRGRRIPGAVGIGAPIIGSEGQVLGVVMLTIPEQRFDTGSLSKLADLVVRCARLITQRIGGRAPAIVGRPERKQSR